VMELGGCRCLAACVLNVHYHLLLEVEDGVLPRVMAQINGRYARAYNSRYGGRGHAFADRYFSIHVTSTPQLLMVFRYIARNPVEAGLCERPQDWLWSSYRTAIGLDGRFSFVDPSFVVGCCDGSLEELRRFVEGDAQPRSGA